MLARPASLWGRPDFLRLWCGQFVSEFGSQITLLALPLAAILVLHASTIQVATLTTLEFSPYLFFALAAGALVDRLPRRPVMVVADIGRAALLGSVPLAYAFDALTLPQLYAVGFAAGTLTVFFGLAYQAYLPQLVERERLLEANGKLEAARSVAQTGGPGAGGGLVALFSAPGAVLADAISFVVSALLITSIRQREERPSVPEKRDLRAEVDEGIRYVWRQPVLRANLFSSGLANFAYGAIWALLLVFAVRMLGLHAGLIGVILALGQGGGILGAVFAGRIAGRIGAGPTFIFAMASFGPGMLLIALANRSTAIPFLAVGWALASFATATTSVIGIGIRQAMVPQRLQGRVVGATRTVILGIAPLGSLAGGGLAAAFGLREALLVGAAISCVAFVPLLLSPARRLHELPAVQG
jgi:MFS family permease